MRSLVLGLALSMALAGCGVKEDAARADAAKKAGGDAAAGKAIAERECKSCHGMQGKGAAPAIPNLAAQRERYLVTALTEYKDGKRPHAALKDMAAHMTEAELRNVAAYYASLPPLPQVEAKPAPSSAHEQGKKLAASCAKCHGEDGNAKTPGIPSLAGQQPHYLVTAIQEYHQGEREKESMRLIMRDSTRLELEQLALYFASQKPVSRGPARSGDAAAGEPLSAVCGGCHGARGVSADAATPSLAGQDPQYLVRSIKSYRTTRKNWGMQRFVGGLGDKDIDNIVAYYATQTPQAADTVPSSAKELAQKCNRCHDDESNLSMSAPKMNGQDKDYLIMALRAYRDDKRESTTMHKMTTPYSNAIIESIASWYASQPAK